MPQIPRPQVRRVRRELLPHHVWTHAELRAWRSQTQTRYARANAARAKRRLRRQRVREALRCVA